VILVVGHVGGVPLEEGAVMALPVLGAIGAVLTSYARRLLGSRRTVRSPAQLVADGRQDAVAEQLEAARLAETEGCAEVDAPRAG
jgi:hypothetical protein